MAKNKETDNKNDNKEQKVVKKSSYSKKKKIKKNIPSGIAYVQSSFNNTIVLSVGSLYLIGEILNLN